MNTVPQHKVNFNSVAETKYRYRHGIGLKFINKSMIRGTSTKSNAFLLSI